MNISNPFTSRSLCEQSLSQVSSNVPVRLSKKDHRLALLQGSFHPNPLKHGLSTWRYEDTISIFESCSAPYKLGLLGQKADLCTANSLTAQPLALVSARTHTHKALTTSTCVSKIGRSHVASPCCPDLLIRYAQGCSAAEAH